MRARASRQHDCQYSFQDANLAQSTFFQRCAFSTKFMGAVRANAFFDRTRLCGGDFSGANLPELLPGRHSIRVPNFKTPPGWRWVGGSCADQLNKLSDEDLTKDTRFRSDKGSGLHQCDQGRRYANISNSAVTINTPFDRASALNGKRPGQWPSTACLERVAEKLVGDAITILNANLMRSPPTTRYTNSRTRWRYIRLQRGTIPQSVG